MAIAETDCISDTEARHICEKAFRCSGPSPGGSWVSILSSEGLFRKDHLFNDERDPLAGPKVVYRFTYQRFSDHLIVQALLKDIDDIDGAFQPAGPLRFLVEGKSHRAWSSLWNALAIQIPEKFGGREFLDVVSKDMDISTYDYTINNAFQQSLLWRSSAAFSERTLELFNELPMEMNDPRIEIIVRLATLRDHPWNAELLGRNLKRLPMPERDAFWTVRINEVTKNDMHPIWN